MRKELRIGLLAGVLSSILNRFTSTPNLIVGMLTGIGLCFLFVGILPIHVYDKLKKGKKMIIKKKF